MIIKEYNIYTKNKKPYLKIQRKHKIEYVNQNNIELLLDFFANHIGNLYIEEFYIIGFDAQGKLLGIYMVSRGSHKDTIIYYKESILFLKLLSNIHSFILIHNHPNGILSFSKDDLQFSAHFMEIAEELKIEYLDSIIIYQNQYVLQSQEIDEDYFNFYYL